MSTRSLSRSLLRRDITQELRRRIQSGEWKPGDKLPSYSESKLLFGAHSVAVEKAHAQLEREGLVVREPRRGVFVAKRTESARKVATNLIGVSGLGFTFQEYSPYWIKLLKGIRSVCDEAGKQIVLLDNGSNAGWEVADGVLMCQWSQPRTLELLPPTMPCVSILVPTQGVVSVYADDYNAMREATEFLLKSGHTKIAYLHTKDTTTIKRREDGWRDALKNAGIDPHASWRRVMAASSKLDFGASYVEFGRESMRDWIATDWKQTGCTAILAHNDETALGVIEALQENSIRVPRDVSVVGFDGAWNDEYSSVSLTTMEVPLEKIGAASARLLLRQLEGEVIEDKYRVFPVALRQGESVGPMFKR